MDPSVVPKELPPALHAAFKNIWKHQKAKNYKKALQAADTVLKVLPNQGETLALKALVLHSSGDLEGAYQHARLAVKNNVRSPLCLDVYSSLFRNDKLYHTGAKYSTLALARNPESLQVLRELCNLHIQNRDYAQFQKVSNKLLLVKGDSKPHWMGFAVACHLNGDHERCLSILDAYTSTIAKKDLTTDPFERSELQFFKVLVIEAASGIAEAYKYLVEQKILITDKEEWIQQCAEYEIKLGLTQEAIGHWKELIEGNPENFNFHRGLLVALGIIPETHKSLFHHLKLDEEKIVQLVQLYDEFKKAYPQARACRQIPFAFLDIPRFKAGFSAFVGPAFSKGTVSIFNCVKYLYTDPEKAAAMEEVMLGFEKQLLADQPLPGQTQLEPPSSLLFCYYYLSQHYNTLKKTDLALEYCEKCLKHTPTQVDFYVLKARVYKDAGQFAEAAKWMEEARTLDLADRWLNTKATLYFLRADQVENAEKTISIFTKVECVDKEHNYNNILDMQVMWYEQEEGESWVRQQNYGKALNRFTDIVKHFDEFWSDQMDFHSYCTKKVTLRQYLNFLKMEDNLAGNKFYFRAACAIVQCYLDIDTNPKLGELPEKKQEPAKGAKKGEKEEEAKPKKVGKGKEKSDDGASLLPLGLNEAHKYAQKLTKFSPNETQGWVLTFQVEIRRKKYCQALKALNRIIALDPKNPNAKSFAEELFKAVAAVKDTLPEVVQATFRTEEPKVNAVLSSQK